MKTFEKYLFNTLATSLGFILCPLPKSFAFKSSFIYNWWFSSRYEWNIDIARKVIYILGLGKVHEERMEEIRNAIWYNADNEKALPKFRRHYSSVRKKIHEAIEAQPKQITLKEAKKQIKKYDTRHY